eukprot:2543852-Pyramimonas_sp.AAC.1
MSLEEELAVRTSALKSIFDADECLLHVRPPPLLPLPDPQPAAVTSCFFTRDTVASAMHKMPNWKAAPNIVSAGLLNIGGHAAGVVAELWKMGWDVLEAGVTGVFQASATLLQIPAHFKDGEVSYLRKPKGDGTDA